MTLVRWEPFRELMNLQCRLGRNTSDADDFYGAWAPAVDIFEKGDDLVIRAEIPGVDKDDVDISVRNHSLTLRGERKREQEIDDRKAYRLERSYGNFVRSFTLPRTVDSTRISASYSDGVLDILLPKSEEAKPKKIEIATA
jgi:HSP20 family protein